MVIVSVMVPIEAGKNCNAIHNPYRTKGFCSRKCSHWCEINGCAKKTCNRTDCRCRRR
nr:unnamed protein product [Callosobruchus chinensis]